MSVARKRAKVKKKSKSSAVRRKRKKRVAKASKARTKKKRSKKALSSGKRRASVNTRRKPPSPPKPKRKPSSKRKVKKKRKKKKAPTFLQQIAAEFETTERVVILTAFLQQPAVAAQIRDRIIEKGLAELTRGMVQTKESVIIGHLIIAEQLGNFDQRARELSAEYSMPLRDVYELWLSPKLGEAAA